MTNSNNNDTTEGKPEYKLSLHHLGPHPEKIITRETFEEFNKISEAMQSLLEMEVRFQILVLSMHQMEKVFSEQCISYIFDPNDFFFSKIEITAIVNHQLLSLLSAARMFHDQRVRSLRSIDRVNFGRPSLIDRIKLKYSDIYDTTLNYRIMEQLRNTIQHHEIPINHIRMGGKRVEQGDNSSKWRTTFDPTVDLSMLKYSKSMKSKIRDEINALGIERLDVKEISREYFGKICEGHYCYREMTEDIHQHIVEKQNWARETLRGVEAFKSDVSLSFVEISNGQISNTINFSSQRVERLTNARKRFRRIANYHNQYFSSEFVVT